jgi:hypothetical protein
MRHWEGISYSALCDEDCLLFQIPAFSTSCGMVPVVHISEVVIS